MATDDYRELSLADLLDRLSADGLAPGGGSAAALTVAFAARLVAMVSRCSPTWSDAAGVVAQANAIGDRAVELAHTDGQAWENALVALRDAEASEAADDPRKGFALEQKLEAAAAAPLEIASLGADTAELAALAAEHGEPTYRADAAAAAALAAGGTSAAAHLVRVNLGVRAADPRLGRALTSESAAHDVATRLRESLR